MNSEERVVCLEGVAVLLWSGESGVGGREEEVKERGEAYTPSR